MKILVLGVGNVLYRDEGVGVRVIEELERRYSFPENVHLLDGGTLGLRLVDKIMEYDRMIIIDAALWGGSPGQAKCLSAEKVRMSSRSFQKNIHQLDLPDTLALCRKLGNMPETVVVAVQPFNCADLGDNLTQPLLDNMDNIINLVLRELETAGASWSSKGKGE